MVSCEEDGHSRTQLSLQAMPVGAACAGSLPDLRAPLWWELQLLILVKSSLCSRERSGLRERVWKPPEEQAAFLDMN